MNKIFTALDLEMNQPSGKIIQVGAVVGNIDTGQILTKLSCIVDPKETINPFIAKLTNITEDMIKTEGKSLDEAYDNLRAIHQTHGAFINPIVWGGGDSLELRTELGIGDYWCFGRRWIDVKTLYVSMAIANGMSVQGGLAKVMTKFNMTFKGQKHWAPDDAENTFMLYRKLLTLMPNKDRWR